MEISHPHALKRGLRSQRQHVASKLTTSQHTASMHTLPLLSSTMRGLRGQRQSAANPSLTPHQRKDVQASSLPAAKRGLRGQRQSVVGNSPTDQPIGERRKSLISLCCRQKFSSTEQLKFHTNVKTRKLSTVLLN